MIWRLQRKFIKSFNRYRCLTRLLPYLELGVQLILCVHCMTFHDFHFKFLNNSQSNDLQRPSAVLFFCVWAMAADLCSLQRETSQNIHVKQDGWMNVLWSQNRPDQYLWPITYCYKALAMYFRNYVFFVLINLCQQGMFPFFFLNNNHEAFFFNSAICRGKIERFLLFFPEIFMVRAEVCLFVILLWAYVLLDQYTLVITYQQSISQGFATGLLVTFIIYYWVWSFFYSSALIFIQS